MISENPQCLLHVSGISKQYGRAAALKNIDLLIWENDVTALVGPNGAGKTTLLNIISGWCRPDSGSVKFQGRETTGLSLAQTAKLGIIRVFQKPRVFPQLSVWENVLIGYEAIDHERCSERGERVSELLESVGMYEDRSTPAGSLPFGKKRFLELARALAVRPRLLLLDEPTAGLGPEEQDVLVKLLHNALTAAGVHLLFVEHSLRVVFALATKTILLNCGEKAYEGPAESNTAKEAIEEFYGRHDNIAGY